MISAKLYAAVSNFEGDSDLPMLFLRISLAFSIITPFLNSYINSRLPYRTQSIQGKLMMKIHSKINRLAPIEMEKSETLKAINKAEMGAWGGTALVCNMLLIVFGYGPYFIIIGAWLYRFRSPLGLLPIIAFILVLISQLYKPEAIMSS